MTDVISISKRINKDTFEPYVIVSLNGEQIFMNRYETAQDMSLRELSRMEEAALLAAIVYRQATGGDPLDVNNVEFEEE